MNRTTRRLQAKLDTGKSVILGDDIYEIDERLRRWSVGQRVLGQGPNRTIIRQMSAGEPVFEFLKNGESTVAAHHWLGQYAPSPNCFLGSTAHMSLEGGVENVGPAILADDGDTWLGDYLDIHNILTFRFPVHIKTNGIAQLRIRDTVHQNATTLAAAFGTGLDCKGAVPNSHIIQGVSLTGFAIGADVLADGGVLNFGDVVLCTIGVKARGQFAMTGGHYESCGTYIELGEMVEGGEFMAVADLRGISLQTNSTNTTSPIRVIGSSQITGAQVRGTQGSVPLIEVTHYNGFACIQNFAPGGDQGAGSPGDYLFYNSANSMTRRFSPHKALLNDADIPAAGLGMVGAMFHVHDTDRLIECVYNGGSPQWVDR